MSSFLFRADSSLTIGTGHIRRCLVLARFLYDRGHKSVFMTDTTLDGHMAAILKAAGFDVLSPQEGAKSLKGQPPFDWLIVDHYGLGKAFEESFRPYAGKIAVIDDLADQPHTCDLIINPSPQTTLSQRIPPIVPPGCRILTGLDYLLLNREIPLARGLRPFWAQNPPAVPTRLLVNFGGSDPHGMTAVVLEAIAPLLESYGLKAVVVFGKNLPGEESLRALCAGCPALFDLHIDPPSMAAVLATTHIAVGAGGTSSYERYCLGIPSLVIPVAANQKEAADYAHRQGWCLALPPWSLQKTPLQLPLILESCLKNPQIFRDIFEKSYNLVDGDGPRRITAVLEGYPAPKNP